MLPLQFVGASRKDLLDFPDEIRNEAGHHLYLVQTGGQSTAIKTLSGFGDASVQEVRLNGADGTFRVVYTVRYAGKVYVLHCFQKKSRLGISTPKNDLDLIRSRLARAKEMHEEWRRANPGP